MRIGSLCTGYGGLDMALDGTTVWVSDIDKAACTLLAYRFPDVPNLGDLTTVDWASVEPVDIITAGYPCQPFSHAGKRDGTDDDRHIWPHIAAAIRVLQPRFVFLENVAGHLSLGFGDVLGDLAEAGYDAQWTSLRASDVGACHGRNRLFILATNTDNRRRDRWTQDTRRQPLERTPVTRNSGPTPTDSNGINGINGKESRNARPRTTRRREPVTSHRTATPDTEINEQREPTDRRQVRAEPGNGTWGDYLPAIQRWADTIGRPAPEPTTYSESGRTVLDPAFVEWMMGLPAGWVTDVPGISRTGQLHLLGNGVVPQQARAALAVIA